MIPTRKQAAAIDFIHDSDRPVAWLGPVRGGKTVGALMAVVKHHFEHGGDYAICGFSNGNIERNIAPVLRDLIAEHDPAFTERRIEPKHILTDKGRFHFFSAYDDSRQKVLQGCTLRGALTDEILLYPKSFVMQLIARFTHDKPLWVMTANKEAPSHWIKTQWIDAGKVKVFESTQDDNPHLSQDARTWHSLLLEGAARDRMIGNEWASDTVTVGKAKVVPSIDKVASTDLMIKAYWLDDARGHASAQLIRRALERDLIVTEVNTHGSVSDVIEDAKGRRGMIVANWCDSPQHTPIPGCVFVNDTPVTIAENVSRSPMPISFDERVQSVYNEFAAWLWTTSKDGFTKRPEECSPVTMAAALGVSFGSQANQPIRYVA